MSRLRRRFLARDGVTRQLMHDRRGVVAVMFAMSTLLLAVAVGSGIDLERAYTARQQLSAVATLTCQYANRPTVVSLLFGSGGNPAYASSVNSFYAVAMADQNVAWSQATNTPFSISGSGAGVVSLAASIPTTIMKIIGLSSVPVSVSQQCFTLPAALLQPKPDTTTTLIVNETFENAIYPSSVTWYLPNEAKYVGSHTSEALPVTNTAPANAGYVGVNGSEWIVMGYCLEVDAAGITQSTAPQGTHSAELDCDNGSGTAGNSSISTRFWLSTGNYELRYYYAARTLNTYYKTSYICGTTATDTWWANDTNNMDGSSTFGPRTNQANVYLDQNTNDLPPTHTTLDGTQTLGGSNQIDQCVYSNGWIERSVLINVSVAGYYWLSFAADGANDSFGADIDDIRLCKATCPGTAGDDFPASWLPANNGGNNALLFEDTFESPPYSGSPYDNSGNIGLSYGSSAFWDEDGEGWGVSPVNQTPYWTSQCAQGNQCIQIGWGNETMFAKPLLLDPGYYQILYYYVSELIFSGLSGVYCGATPSAAGMSTLLSGSGAGTTRIEGSQVQGPTSWAAGAVGVFMANAQMASEPIPNTTFGFTTSYTSPGGATEASPSVPNNTISLTSYTPSAISPLVDLCGYAAAWQARTAYVKIQKPAFYWLIFSMAGSFANSGAMIDDVKVTALGSPWTSNPPSNPVLIPVPDPQPGATLSFTGFSITADQY